MLAFISGTGNMVTSREATVQPTETKEEPTKYLIDASLALENEKVVEAIKEKDIQKLKDVLENEF